MSDPYLWPYNIYLFWCMTYVSCRQAALEVPDTTHQYRCMTDVYVHCYRQAALGGLLAGGTGQLLASPADLVKVQMQMEGRRRLLGQKPR